MYKQNSGISSNWKRSQSLVLFIFHNCIEWAFYQFSFQINTISFALPYMKISYLKDDFVLEVQFW